MMVWTTELCHTGLYCFILPLYYSSLFQVLEKNKKVIHSSRFYSILRKAVPSVLRILKLGHRLTLAGELHTCSE